MKRSLALLLVAVLMLTVAGCSTPAAKPTETPSSGAPSKPAAADPFAAITTDGPHEAAAAAAVPAVLKSVEKSVKAAGKQPTDVTSGKATLVAYVLQAKVADKVVLFEVRADGTAHELYQYSKKPDPAKLFWQSAAIAEGASLVDPSGSAELAAADAVRTVVAKAPAGGDVRVMMQGYIFYWIGSDGAPLETAAGGPFNVMIDVKGNAGSWSM